MIAKTTACSRYSHPEFTIAYDAELVVRPDIDWLIATLEAAVAAGECFEDGQTFQIGWGVTIVRSSMDGTLSLFEPQPNRYPIEWRESVSLTLAHCRLQKDVAESVGLLDRIAFPSFRLACIICSQFGKAGALLSRLEPASSTDSGWFLGCNDDAHDHQRPDNLTNISLWQAVVLDPSAIPFLALPPGTLVSLSTGVPTVFYQGHQLSFIPGTLLHRQYFGA